MTVFKQWLVLAVFLPLAACAQKKIVHNQLSGDWLLSLDTRDAGVLKVVMNFETTAGDDTSLCSFEAFTEKDMDKKVLGSWKASLGRLTGSNMKDGSLMRITGGKLKQGDSLFGVLVTPFGNSYFRAGMSNGVMTGALLDGNFQVLGQISGTQGRPAHAIRNYAQILDTVFYKTEHQLYDASLVQQKEWQSFKKDMRRISTITGDDAAFVMGFFYFAKSLPFSHYYLIPTAGKTATDQPKTTAAAEQGNVTLKEQDRNTVYLRIRSFSGAAAEMDSIFRIVTAKGYSNLIADLRDNPGGALEAGLSFTRHLVSDTLQGGIFLTRKYFDAHKKLPEPSAYRQFPVLSEANNRLLFEQISAYAGVALIVYPQEPVFTGKVYLLTNSITASTCEPVVYGLKACKRATVIGQPTAGAMLNSEAFDAGDGFRLTIPTASYYTADGYVIDGKGVQPDILEKEEDILSFTTQLIRQTTTR